MSWYVELSSGTSRQSVYSRNSVCKKNLWIEEIYLPIHLESTYHQIVIIQIYIHTHNNIYIYTYILVGCYKPSFVLCPSAEGLKCRVCSGHSALAYKPSHQISQSTNYWGKKKMFKTTNHYGWLSSPTINDY